MAIFITVGLGYGTPDHETAQIAWNTLSGSDQGDDVVMLCKGNCGTSFTPTGVAANNWSMRTDGVDYDGTNDTDLAYINRVSLQAKLDMRHFRVYSSSAFVSAVNINGTSDGSIYEDVFWEHNNSPSGVDVVQMSGTAPTSILRRAILSGGVNGIDYGYNYVLSTENITQFGATGDGFEGSGSNGTGTDNFAFNNGANDYQLVTTVTCASEDLTGDLTGYTSTELVDFAGKDYRTKLTSALATAGTGTAFVGAYLESGGGGITGTLGLTLDDSLLTATAQLGVDVSGSLTVQIENNTLSASGQIGSNITGTLTEQLADVDLVGVGVLGNVLSGTLSTTNEDVTVVGTGQLGNDITGVVTGVHGQNTLSATGQLGSDILGTLAKVSGQNTLTATGSMGNAISGTLSVPLDSNTLDALGFVGNSISGTMSTLLNNTILNATGQYGADIVGTLTVTVEDNTTNGVGQIGNAIIGTLDTTLDLTSLLASGTLGAITGSMFVVNDDATLTGVGISNIIEYKVGDLSLNGILGSNNVDITMKFTLTDINLRGIQ